MDILPHELITKVLSKLPVRWVLRCRSVCKYWRSLIDNSCFSIMHLDSTCETRVSRSTSTLILVSNFEDDAVLILELSYVGTCTSSQSQACVFNSTKITLPFSLEGLNNSSHLVSTKLVGYCHGLLCFSRSNNICISNPATGQYVLLPNIEFWSPYSDCIGFGFNSSIKEFKLVILSCWEKVEHPHDHYPLKIHVYTLSSNSWRTIKGHGPLIILNGYGVVANGSLYWRRYTDDDGNCPSIFSFDLESERYETFQGPKFSFRPDVDVWYELVVVGDGLGMSNCDALDADCEIWIMKEYNGEKSWIKQYVIRNLLMPEMEHSVIHPVSVCDNGDLIPNVHRCFLMSYDFEIRKATLLEDNGVEKYKVQRFFKSFPFVGNLISLNAA